MQQWKQQAQSYTSLEVAENDQSGLHAWQIRFEIVIAKFSSFCEENGKSVQCPQKYPSKVDQVRLRYVLLQVLSETAAFWGNNQKNICCKHKFIKEAVT